MQKYTEKKQIKKIYNSQIIAEFLSTLADTLFFPAMISIAIGFENSAFLLAAVTASEYLPYILSPLLGNFVDNIKKKVSIIYITSCLQSLLYLVTTFILFENGKSQMLLFILIGFNFISGILNKINNTSQLVLVLNLIDDEDEIKAYRGNNIMAKTVVQIIGQFIGASLLIYMSMEAISLINAVLFLLPLLVLRKSFPSLMKSSENLLENKINDSTHIVEVLKSLMKSSELLLLLIFVGLANFVIIPLSSLFVPELLQVIDDLDYKRITLFYSIVVMIYGIGIVVGVLVNPKLKRFTKQLFRTLIFSLVIVGFIFISLAKISTFPLVLLFSFLFGAISGIFNMNSEVYFYTVIPIEHAASYNGIMQAITMSAGIVSTGIASLLIQKILIRNTLFIYGILVLVISFGMFLFLKNRKTSSDSQSDQN